MRRKALLPSALAAIALLVLAACGGDDSSSDASSSAAEPLTADQYVAAADAICADADEKLEALGEPADDGSNISEFLLDGIEIAEEQLAQLRALATPAEFEEQASRAYELLDQVNGKAREAAAAFGDGDLAAGSDILTEAEPLSTELDELADELGLTVCSS